MIQGLSRMPLRSVSPALPSDQSDDHQQDHRADGGAEDLADHPERQPDAEARKQESRDQGADDADHDVADQTEAVAPNNLAREPAGNRADQQKDDQTHSLSPPQGGPGAAAPPLMLRCSDGRIRYSGLIVSYAGAVFRIATRFAERSSAAARRAISATTTAAAAKPLGTATNGNARIRPQDAAIAGSS